MCCFDCSEGGVALEELSYRLELKCLTKKKAHVPDDGQSSSRGLEGVAVGDDGAHALAFLVGKLTCTGLEADRFEFDAGKLGGVQGSGQLLAIHPRRAEELKWGVRSAA